MSEPDDDDLQPIIPMWASCAQCDMAFVLRRSQSWSGGWMWLWCPDCKCRKRAVDPVIHDERVPS